MTGQSAIEVVDARAVRAALGGISAKTLKRLIAARRFPTAFNITAQRQVWLRQDVEWFLWGRQIRSRMEKKARTTVDNAGTTVDKRDRKAT